MSESGETKDDAKTDDAQLPKKRWIPLKSFGLMIV